MLGQRPVQGAAISFKFLELLLYALIREASAVRAVFGFAAREPSGNPTQLLSESITLCSRARRPMQPKYLFFEYIHQAILDPTIEDDCKRAGG